MVQKAVSRWPSSSIISHEGELVVCHGVQRSEDARTSHPCERGAGLLSQLKKTGSRRRKILLCDSQHFMWRCVMSMEPRNFPKENFSALQGCLVEGDSEQQAQQRRVRRRSLAISVLLQAAVLIALVLLPLFGKTQRLALANITPVPPYSRYREVASRPAGPENPAPQSTCRFCPPTLIPQRIYMQQTEPGAGPGEPELPGVIPGGPETRGLIPLGDARPRKPDEGLVEQQRPRMVHIARIDPAQLRHRVEPGYPALARQIHREGRVEVHAIIGTDGTMQFVQVVSGDPLFYSSALEAVQQWIYKPTYLNGQPVQVDTTITVIYSMQH